MSKMCLPMRIFPMTSWSSWADPGCIGFALSHFLARGNLPDRTHRATLRQL
jgi:hypothetical protein